LSVGAQGFRRVWGSGSRKIVSRKAQSFRKGAKKTLRNAAALCAFAPLREKSSWISFGRLARKRR
jgi:hypothetical protein